MSTLKSVLFVSFLSLAALPAVGCASDQTPQLPADDGGVSRKQAEAANQRARAEINAIRAEIATARIAAAKKEAEVQELRRQLAQVSQGETQRQQMTENNSAEVMMLRAEREKLLREKSELQAQVANPQSPRVAAEGPASHDKMQAMNTALSLLAHELAQVKQQLAKNQPGDKSKGKGKGKDKGPDLMPSSATEESAPRLQPAVMESAPEPDRTPGATIKHTVQPGESLFGIARQYGVTVDELKKANGLKGEVMQAGQRLRIPATQ